MAYKNTAGTTSIANEMGTWRYFNSSLAKLGEYKGANLNIDSSKVTADLEGDWVNALGLAFKQASKDFDQYQIDEAKRQQVKKKEVEDLADKYFQSHSIEQYQQDIKNNRIPFQDNPFAMSRLKYLHGRMAYNLTYQDFVNEQVNTNKLAGKSQVEVDSEFYQYAKESQKDLADSFGYSMDDEFFKEGFFETSPEGRLKVIAQKEAVEDKWETEKSLIADSSNIATIINSGSPNAGQAFLNYLDQMGRTTGANYSPEMQYKLLNNAFQMASKSRYGSQLIESIADKEIPFIKGTTFRELLGEDNLKAWLVNAETVKAADNAMEFSHWCDDIDKYVEDGNYVLLSQLKDEEYLSNNNVETPRTKYLDQAIRNAKRTAQANLKAAGKVRGDALYEEYLGDTLKANITGTAVPTEEAFRKVLQDAGISLNSNDMKVIGQGFVQKIFTGGDPKKISMLLTMATSKGTPNSIREPVTEMLKEYYQDLDHRLNEIAMTGKISSKDAVDLLTDKEAGDFQYNIPGQARAISISGLSPGFQTLMSLYSTNPSAVRQILTNGTYGDTRVYSQLSTVDMAIRLGKNPLQVLASAQAFKAQQQRKALESGAPLEQLLPRFRVDRNEIQGLVGTGGLNRATTDMLDTLVWAEIRAYKDANPTDDTSIRKLGKAAMEKVANEFVGVRGFVLPIASIQQGLGEVGVTPQSPEDLAKYANEVFKDYMSERGLNTPMLYDSSFYDVNRDNISVVALDGTENMVIPMKDFTARIKAKIVKNIEEGSKFKWPTIHTFR